ncbi:flagellar biosynthesis protein FliP [Wenyingzhuangia heitensis]|uniref:Flagellar biosynthesis protein FliP n=1 Tax=Wenyingzhuangia heitensis TaxID=1487859 RepID=A0ABX0U745_9FLAO|nr:hypothetical protein [Wenyingzhuangia heitensis]NIJ44573.1 flagellar biosynthesis protein FliP [Wenyingzhuangia heitensis]
MKKLLFVFALLLTVTMSAQEKKSFKGALEAANLTEVEMTKAMEIQKEKTTALKEVKESDLDAVAKKAKVKEIKQEAGKKLRAAIGKEKTKAMNQYWKK